jgi:hypothetical protein
MSVPATRYLATVLRRELVAGEAVRLVVATVGSPVVAAELNGYVNVTIQGTTVKVPKLRHLATPAAGAPAYVLATGDFMLYIGTVALT